MQNNNEHLCVNEFRCSRGTMIDPDTEGAVNERKRPLGELPVT